MAEALVTFLIEQLASVTLESIQENVSLVKNADKYVKKLESNLKAIQAVLDDAEKKQLTNSSLKDWLEKLKEVSFDIDNVLDDWKTSILELKIQKEAGSADAVVDDKAKKVCCFPLPLPLSCCGEFTHVNRLTMRHHIARQIKDLNQRLAEIATEKDHFKLSMTATEKPLERPRTTSFVDETEVEGRDLEKDLLVSKLLSEDSGHGGIRELLIIPLVGMGGLGKTTLAQLVYNDEKVKAHFDKLIWVCVSDPFDQIKVSKAILESSKDRVPNSNELETLMQSVRECVTEKRFLLILDDVWTEDSAKWNQLKQPLKCGAQGSRVLVTTRKEEVAIMMGASNHVVRLELLSQEHCWLIFKGQAFFERTEEEKRQLEDMGRKLADKSKGLPLVARTLGGLMRSKKTKSQWEDVLHSELWNNLYNDLFTKEIFASLLLSYRDLSPKERRCFSYCSIFPKDHNIDVEEMIQIWMSQNYLSCEPNFEEEGRACFDNLAMRSFFQNFTKLGDDSSIKFCKMHDIVHDFAQFLTENECLTIEVDSVEGKIWKPLDGKTRHLTLVVVYNAKFPTLNYSEMNNRNLRTLHILSGSSSMVDFSFLLHLTYLRSLTLFFCGIKKLPTSIGNLKHLRYLNLSCNWELEELPDTLCCLCNLITLNLSACSALCRLPRGMEKLVNLRHLYVYNCENVEGFPKALGKLTSLRSLYPIFVPENKEEFFDIGDLKKLTKLRFDQNYYFEIKQCRELGSRNEAEKAYLNNIIRQQSYKLILNFGQWREGNGRLEEDGEILEGLEPHQNLERLDIINYRGTILSPSWMMSLSNLRGLSLSDCERFEMLPSLGRLSSLESLYFSGMKGVKKVGFEFIGITETENEGEIQAEWPITMFPKLEELYFVRMEQLEKWEGSGSDEVASVSATTRCSLNRIMPCLKCLGFSECPRLRILPDFLEAKTSLKTLYINESDIIEEWCKKRSGKEWAKISHIPNLEVNNKLVRKDGVWIQEHNPILDKPSPSE